MRRPLHEVLAPKDWDVLLGFFRQRWGAAEALKVLLRARVEDATPRAQRLCRFFQARAVTLLHTIYLPEPLNALTDPLVLLAHELVHVRQWGENPLAWLGYLVRYGWGLLAMIPPALKEALRRPRAAGFWPRFLGALHDRMYAFPTGHWAEVEAMKAERAFREAQHRVG